MARNKSLGASSMILSVLRTRRNRMRPVEKGVLAESEGFEPSDPVTQIGSLANYWFQPLTHDSAQAAL